MEINSLKQSDILVKIFNKLFSDNLLFSYDIDLSDINCFDNIKNKENNK